MVNNYFAYFLTATNIKEKDASMLMKMMLKKDFFDGALVAEYTREDKSQNRVYFDCGSHGCINEIDRDAVDFAMHGLAKAFPNARFHLLAENVDNSAEQYQICTYGDMYQFSECQSYMPELSKPVPFDQRAIAQPTFGERDFLNAFLNQTDFDLLYQQKQALLKAQSQKLPLDPEVIDGLVNFLDFIGDWAEKEGAFVYPAYDREELLESIVQFARNELPEAGKIAYPLPDGNSFVSISVKEGSYESMNPGKDFYAVEVTGAVQAGTTYVDPKDLDALREVCSSCLDFYDGKKNDMKPSLDNLILSASDRTQSPSPGQSKDRGFEID